MSPTAQHPDADRLAAGRAMVTHLMARDHVPGLSVAVTDSELLLFAE